VVIVHKQVLISHKIDALLLTELCVLSFVAGK